MAFDVTCRQCGKVFEAGSNKDSTKQTHCPHCGSTIHNILPDRSEILTISAVAKVSIEDVVSSSNLLLQTVIVPGGKTQEGLLIEAVTIPWFEIIDLLKKDPAVAFQISPQKWEEIIAGAYKKAGFEEVTLTPRSGDYGRDVIAIKKGIGCVRVIDQVKAYKPGHLVTANDVRALMGVLQGDKASKGFLTTTSDFAPKIQEDPLIIPFIPARLELINGEKLLKRLYELSTRKGK
jgi:restriction system protein